MRPGSARGQERAKRAALTFNAGQGDAVSGQRVRYLGQVVIRGIGDARAVGLGFTSFTWLGPANLNRLSITAYTEITLDTTG
jgi:hypothetical protein